MNLNSRTKKIGWCFLIPAALFLLLFCVIPFVWNIVLAFVKWDGFSPMSWCGLANFSRIIRDKTTLHALKNSVIYAFCSTAGGVCLGLLFAVLIHKLGQREGNVFRVILYSPAMLPAAVVGIMFVFFFNPEMGLLNSFFRLVGLESFRHVWLQERATAMACLIFVAIWKCSGSVMMITFAAIQGIPASLYESSHLDGASYLQQTLQITFPLIRPMILLAAMNTLGAQFKSFDLIYTMTQGGPANLTMTVPIIMKKTAFIFGSFGSAAAIGVVFTIVVALSLILLRRSLRGETYEY